VRESRGSFELSLVLERIMREKEERENLNPVKQKEETFANWLQFRRDETFPAKGLRASSGKKCEKER